MNKPRSHAAPLVVVVVIGLLLPTLYVASYCCLIVSEDIYSDGKYVGTLRGYRGGGMVVATAFWPLEQIDRWLWPESWSGRKRIFDDARSRQIERNLGGNY